MTSAPAVLHLCSDYAKQAIYSELVSRLDGLGVRQCVYVPVRSRSEWQTTAWISSARSSPGQPSTSA